MAVASPLGPIQAENPDEQLLGRIPVRNLWYLLLYAWELADFKDRYAQVGEEAPTLKELFARLLVQITRDIIRQGIHRTYIPTDASLQGIKGRILFSESIKRNAFQQQRVVCRFTHYDENNLLNQIVKATILSLIVWLRRENSVANRVLIHDLLVVLPYFQNVDEIRLYPMLFQQVVIHRNNRAYHLLLQLCQMIYQATMPSADRGGDAFLRIIREQLQGHQLYERFLRQFYVLHVPTHRVSSEKLHWPAFPVSEFMPIMTTDITLHPKGCDAARIVIDAKWYAHTLVTSHRGNKDRFHTGHLYQLYAYLRTQEEHGEVYRRAKGILLYPAVTTMLGECFEVQGHPIKVATVNLAQPWPEVEARLIDVVSRWPHENVR